MKKWDPRIKLNLIKHNMEPGTTLDQLRKKYNLKALNDLLEGLEEIVKSLYINSVFMLLNMSKGDLLEVSDVGIFDFLHVFLV